MEKFTSIFSVVFTMVLFPSCAQKTTLNEYKANFAAEFKSDLKENKVTHAAYAVFNMDSILFQDNYTANQSAVNSDSPFLEKQ